MLNLLGRIALVIVALQIISRGGYHFFQKDRVAESKQRMQETVLRYKERHKESQEFRLRHKSSLALLDSITKNPDTSLQTNLQFFADSKALSDRCSRQLENVVDCSNSLAAWETTYKKEIDTVRKLNALKIVRDSRTSFAKLSKGRPNPFDELINFCERKETTYAECEANTGAAALIYAGLTISNREAQIDFAHGEQKPQ